jgi:hypothetical protein
MITELPSGRLALAGVRRSQPGSGRPEFVRPAAPIQNGYGGEFERVQVVVSASAGRPAGAVLDSTAAHGLRPVPPARCPSSPARRPGARRRPRGLAG